jgi:hypothetical protein
MSHNTFDQFNDLVTRLAAADGTVAAERSHEILDTELAREVLEAIVAGLDSRGGNQYSPGGLYRDPPIREYPPIEVDWGFESREGYWI